MGHGATGNSVSRIDAYKNGSDILVAVLDASLEFVLSLVSLCCWDAWAKVRWS